MKKYNHPIAKFHELKADRSLLAGSDQNVQVRLTDTTGNAFSKSASFSFDEDGE